MNNKQGSGPGHKKIYIYLEKDFDSLGGGSDEGSRESTESASKGKFGYGQCLLGSSGAERVHQSLTEVITLYGVCQ